MRHDRVMAEVLQLLLSDKDCFKVDAHVIPYVERHHIIHIPYPMLSGHNVYYIHYVVLKTRPWEIWLCHNDDENAIWRFHWVILVPGWFPEFCVEFPAANDYPCVYIEHFPSELPGRHSVSRLFDHDRFEWLSVQVQQVWVHRKILCAHAGRRLQRIGHTPNAIEFLCFSLVVWAGQQRMHEDNGQLVL